MEIAVKAENPFLESCTPVFFLTSVFRQGNRGVDIDQDYGEKLKSAIDKLEHELFSRQLPLFEVQQVKYALAAYADEAVLNSEWSSRVEWMGSSLQLQYFGEHLAGEGFFKRLNDLRQAGAKYVNILEVFYVCLQLGFEGRYRLQGLEQLMALQVDLRAQIEMVRKSDAVGRTKNLLPRQITAKVANKLPYWVIGVVTSMLIFGIHIGYSMAINSQAKSVLNALNKIHRELIYKDNLGD